MFYKKVIRKFQAHGIKKLSKDQLQLLKAALQLQVLIKLEKEGKVICHKDGSYTAIDPLVSVPPFWRSNQD